MRNLLQSTCLSGFLISWLIGWSAGFFPLAAQEAILSNPSACNLGLAIRDYSCADDGAFRTPSRFAIDVGNARGTALGRDVFLSEVRLIIRHPWSGDLDITLRSPGGQSVLITADNGGGDDNYGLAEAGDCQGYARFVAGACLSVSDGKAPFTSGPYEPQESFLLLNDGQTNPNGRWMLEICDDAQEDAGSLEFVELVFEPIRCLPVISLLVEDIDTTTVNLNWEPSNSCGTNIIEYGHPGFRPGTGPEAGEGRVVVFTGCPPYRLRGLAPETDYDIYIRKSCDTGNFSANACSVRIKTGCQPPPATIAETFDAQALCQPVCGIACPLTGVWRNSPSGDQADWIVYRGDTPTQGTGPASDAGGQGNYVYFEASESPDCHSGSQAWLLSNCIRFDRKGSDTCHLSFSYHMSGSGTGTLRLESSTDGGFTWIPRWERRGEQGNSWRKVYLSLADLNDGAVVQFRFTATRGTDAKGDIALDDIVFYGSEDLGPAINRYYADADGDGYGDESKVNNSCGENPPAGYAERGGDCNDNDPAIHPGQPEIPCDGLDNNCNGEADDLVLPAPLPVHDTICSGETPEICANPRSDKFILWYGSATGDDFLGVIGSCYSPVLPPNNSPVPVVHRFYAEETDFICRSGQRAEVIVVVHPNPDVFTSAQPAVCPGQEFDLNSLPIQDVRFTGAVLSFHSQSPATPGNRLSSALVAPDRSTTFYFLATSPEGCTDEGQVSLRLKTGPALSFSPARNFNLCRESTQRVTVQASGGSGAYDYRWSTGAGSSAIDIQAAFQTGRTDSYRVTVTDSEGCFTADSVQVTTKSSIEAVRRVIGKVSTCGGADGSIELTPLSGLPPFRFRWQSANGISDDSSGITQTLLISGLPQGAYRITVTDNSSERCEFILRNTVVNGPNAVIGEPDIRPVSCAGAADGRICLPVSGISPRFRWSTGDTASCVEGLVGGTYSVTVTDGSCENVINDLTIAEPQPLSVRFETVAPSCADAADGRLEALVFGGNGNYQFRWGNGGSDARLTALKAGSYVLELSDGNGCLLTDSVELAAPAPLSVLAESQSDMSCAGVADGLLQVSGSGGTAPYRYRWSTGSSSPLQVQLSQGRYSVTVTDFRGCQESTVFDIREPDPLRLTLEEQVRPLCVGDTTGRLRAGVTGVNSGYRFFWNTGDTARQITGLGVGDYELRVEDANGCRSDTLRVLLAARSVLSLSAVISEPECLGATNGSIALRPGGQGPFIYRWGRGDTISLLSGVAAGTYPVTVTDGQGCRFDTNLVVGARQVFRVQMVSRQPSCNGASDGLINPVVLSGGTPPLSYRWSDGSSGSSLLGIEQGSYLLTLTDSRGCLFLSDTIQIEDPPPLRVTVADIGRINCKGDSTGFIELAVSGGVAPYAFNWQNLRETGSAVFNLKAGEYRVQVTDANNCPGNASATLLEPAALKVAVDIQISDGCRGNGGNRISALAGGGIPGYSYRWSTGASDAVLTDLAPGDYALTVEDANRCTGVVPSVKVREASQPLRLESFTATDVSCFGKRDGRLSVRVSGGKPAYRFHFSNNQIITSASNVVTLSGLPRSNGYSVTVTDLNTGCTVASGRLPLREPSLLSMRIDSIDQIDCFGGVDGAIYTTTLGGVTPYSYVWLDESGRTLSQSDDLLQTSAGTFRGIVVDAKGCADTLDPVTLFSLNQELRLLDSLTAVTNLACRADGSGRIDITLEGGTPPYDFFWSSGARTEDIDSLAAGSYSLTVTDSKNCRLLLPPILVTEPPLSLTVSGSGGNVTCFGGRDGKIQTRIQGGQAPYMLTWVRDQDTLATGLSGLDSLKAGLYTLYVRDNAGCERSFLFEVGQPDSLGVAIDILPPDPPDFPGRAVARVNGGSPGYSFLWNTGDNDSVIDTLRESRYRITVTDQNGCTATDSVLLTTIYEPSVIRSARVFPNPASGLVTLEFSVAQRTDLRLEILNAEGRRVSGEWISGAFREQVTLDLTVLPPGGYSVVLYKGKKVVFTSIVLKR